MSNAIILAALAIACFAFGTAMHIVNRIMDHKDAKEEREEARKNGDLK